MSPALNGSSAIWRFEGSNAIKIRDGKTFDFYTDCHICMVVHSGLPSYQGPPLKMVSSMNTNQKTTKQGRPGNKASSVVHIFVGNWVIPYSRKIWRGFKFGGLAVGV